MIIKCDFTGKEKTLIENLEKSADVALKFNYDLGEIMGLNPEVMAQMTKDKVNDFIKLANKDFSSLPLDIYCKSFSLDINFSESFELISSLLVCSLLYSKLIFMRS